MSVKKIMITFGVILAVGLIVLVFKLSVDSEADDLATTAVDTSNDTILDFRITWTDYSGRGEAIQSIVDSYNEKYNNGYTIHMTGGDEDSLAIQSLLCDDSKTIFVLPYRYVKYFGSQGYLADLTTDFKSAEGLFYSEIWKLGSANGLTYGIPWLGHSMCLIYNKKLLAQAGVNPTSITSLDTLLGAIKTVETKTSAKGIGLVGAQGNDVSWMVNQFIYGFGSTLVSEDGKKVTINNERAKAALDYYKNVLGPHAQPTWINDTGVEAMTAFRNQQVAFEIQAIWGVTDILKNGNNFETGIITMKDIGLCAEVGPMMLALPTQMDEDTKKEAENFIDYMISTQAQEKIMNGEYSPEYDAFYPFRTPIRKDMANSNIMQNYPEYQPFIDGFQNISVDVPVPKWQVIKDTYYSPGLHKVMINEMTIDDFLKTIETEGNKLLNE